MSVPKYGMVLLLVFCFGIAVQPGVGKGLRTLAPKRSMMSGRIVAKVPLEGVSSIGLNYESYIFEVASGDKHGTKQLIKFSYRFDQRDPRLPKSFFDYSLTHTFHVTRDEDCDETWGSISSRFIFDRTGGYQGKQDALVYAKNAPVTQPDAQLILTCYAGTPQDYRSTVKSAT